VYRSEDRAPTYPRVLDELLATAQHVTEQYANNPIEADHGRLKSRLRPMRGLKRLRWARVIHHHPRDWATQILSVISQPSPAGTTSRCATTSRAATSQEPGMIVWLSLILILVLREFSGPAMRLFLWLLGLRYPLSHQPLE
jgi:hypothetical protein